MKKPGLISLFLLASCGATSYREDITYQDKSYHSLIGNPAGDEDFYVVNFHPDKPFAPNENVTAAVDYFSKVADNKMKAICTAKNKRSINWSNPLIASKQGVDYTGKQVPDNTHNPDKNWNTNRIWFYYKCE